MGECDSLGSREFNARYRFGRAHDATVWQGGVEYDARALMGLAYLRSTGQTVPAEEFDNGGEDGAVLPAQGARVRRRRRREADARAADAREAPAAPRTAPAEGVQAGRRRDAHPRRSGSWSGRAPPSPDMPEPKICPNCFMALPATGICDNCE